MTRLNILRAIIISILALAPVVSAGAAEYDKNIGIQLYSVMDAMNKDPKTSVELLTDMG